MELEGEGALEGGGVGGVGDAGDAVEPGLVGLSVDFDFEFVPILLFHGGDGLLAFDGIAFTGNVGRRSEVSLERSGNADLDLVFPISDHDPGVDGAFAVFEFERENEVAVFLFCREERSLFFWSGFAKKDAVFDGPMFDFAFGVNTPTGEVFAVEDGFPGEGGDWGDKDESGK